VNEEKKDEQTPKEQREAKLYELLTQKFVETWFASGENKFENVLTPAMAARAAISVFEPLLNALDEVATAADRLNKTHADLVQDSPDPGSEALAAEWEMTRLLKKLRYFEPHDWTYISRFSATPSEVHKILKDGLCEDVYLNYQRFICEVALNGVLDEQHERVEAESGEPGCWHDGAHSVIKLLDPAKEGFRFPADLINPA